MFSLNRLGFGQKDSSYPSGFQLFNHFFGLLDYISLNLLDYGLNIKGTEAPKKSRFCPTLISHRHVLIRFWGVSATSVFNTSVEKSCHNITICKSLKSTECCCAQIKGS